MSDNCVKGNKGSSAKKDIPSRDKLPPRKEMSSRDSRRSPRNDRKGRDPPRRDSRPDRKRNGPDHSRRSRSPIRRNRGGSRDRLLPRRSPIRNRRRSPSPFNFPSRQRTPSPRNREVRLSPLPSEFERTSSYRSYSPRTFHQLGLSDWLNPTPPSPPSINPVRWEVARNSPFQRSLSPNWIKEPSPSRRSTFFEDRTQQRRSRSPRLLPDQERGPRSSEKNIQIPWTSMKQETIKEERFLGQQLNRLREQASLITGNITDSMFQDLYVQSFSNQRQISNLTDSRSSRFLQTDVTPQSNIWLPTLQMPQTDSQFLPNRFGLTTKEEDKNVRVQSKNQEPTSSHPIREKDVEKWFVKISKQTTSISDSALTRDQAEMIQTCLLHKVDTTNAQFKNCRLQHGVLVVECANETSFLWLKKTVPNLVPWKGAQLTTETTVKRKKAFRVSVWIPKPHHDLRAKDVITKFSMQNEGFKTELWNVIDRKVYIGGKRQRLELKIDEESYEYLVKNDFKAYFGLGQVFFKFIGQM